ncbi:MAG: universal stress protein, partial [Candidatus Nitrosocosmicus sp.]|nr:universal stress protein [Candidatus Nitrosocosmicus sp.]
MSTNNEITPVGNSDIIPSKDIHNESQNEIKPVSTSSNYDSEFESSVPPFKKILVTYDGTKKSAKAINYSIYLSNITKAEIVILQVLENIDKLENSSMDISNENGDTKPEVSSTDESDLRKHNYYSINVEGEIIKSMEDKIKEIESTGFKNKVSYKIRAGFIVDEIAKETLESKYDLLIISSSHMDSWIKSFFSETRKIISNVDLPVLLL